MEVHQKQNQAGLTKGLTTVYIAISIVGPRLAQCNTPQSPYHSLPDVGLEFILIEQPYCKHFKHNIQFDNVVILFLNWFKIVFLSYYITWSSIFQDHTVA